MPVTSRLQMRDLPKVIYNISNDFRKNPFGNPIIKQLHNGKWYGYFEMRYWLFCKKRYFIAKHSSAHMLALVDITTEARCNSIFLFDTNKEVVEMANKILDESKKDWEHIHDRDKTLKEMLK